MKDKIILSVVLLIQFLCSAISQTHVILSGFSFNEIISFLTFMIYLISKADEVLTGLTKLKDKFLNLIKK